MEKIKERIIILRVKMRDPKGVLIPHGVTEELTAEIADEVAVFHFRNSSTTRRFALTAMRLERARGANDTAYIERIGKATTRYKGLKKEEIRDLLLKQFQQMGVNAK